MAKIKTQPKKKLNKLKLRLVKKLDSKGHQISRWMRAEDDHPVDEVLARAKEIEKKRRRAAADAYQARVQKIDPDATMTYMYGLKGGRGVMVNEKKGIAYLTADKESGKLRPVNLANLKKVIKGRRKSTGSLDDIFDRAPEDHIHHLLEQNDARTVKVEDESVKSGSTIRSFKVVDSPQGPIITEGSFKGFYLDDMVTAKQRLRGSAGYVVDPATGKAMRRITKKNGRRMVNVFHEVYMKKQGGKARIYVPHGDKETIRLLQEAGVKREAAGGHIFMTPLHQVMGLTKIIGSFSMDKKVSEAVDSSVAQRNAALLRGYMDEDSERMKAAAEAIKSLQSAEYDGLRGYDIKGMNREVAGKTFQLRYTQIQALRTMIARATAEKPAGSIVGLDTGLGKTLLAIAHHMKMTELGGYKHKNNGKMCIVTINTNFPTYINEINTFVDKKAAGEWVRGADGSYSNNLFTIYPQSKFSTAYVEKPENASKLKEYASILCDEPQDWMKNKSSNANKFISNLDHPQKYISSESVMTKKPVEIANYLNITNNRFDEEDRSNAAKSFTAMFEGGRAKIPKEQYEQNVKTFIRDNVIYYHKTDEPTMVFHTGTDHYRFPGMRGEENGERSFHAVEMPEVVKAHYNKLAAPIASTLKSAYDEFKKMKEEAGAGDIRDEEEKLNSLTGEGVMKRMNELRQFMAMPENFIPELKGVNPKLEHAARVLRDHKANGRVALTFASRPEMVIKSAQRFSRELGHNQLSICFTAPSGNKFDGAKSVDPASRELGKHNGKITVWHNGKVLRSVPVKEYMGGEGKNGKIRNMSTVMKDLLEEIKTDKNIPKKVSAGLKWGSIHATDGYNAGHNLQADAHAIMHLDRDDWNSKVLYQRESRIMRPGSIPNSDEIAERLGVPKGTTFSAVTRGTVHYFDVEDMPGMEQSTEILEKMRGEHESKLFDRIVFQSNKAKITDAGVTSKTAKQVFQTRRKPDRMLAMADLGDNRARMIGAQNADAMISSQVA